MEPSEPLVECRRVQLLVDGREGEVEERVELSRRDVKSSEEGDKG
jgi:hypothetical protein